MPPVPAVSSLSWRIISPPILWKTMTLQFLYFSLLSLSSSHLCFLSLSWCLWVKVSFPFPKLSVAFYMLLPLTYDLYPVLTILSSKILSIGFFLFAPKYFQFFLHENINPIICSLYFEGSSWNSETQHSSPLFFLFLLCIF
jgi:hypothetical protein